MMATHGCSDCRHCKIYYGDYYTPDDYECEMPDKDYGLTDEQMDEIFTRVFENGEEWGDNDKPICPAYEKEA